MLNNHDFLWISRENHVISFSFECCFEKVEIECHFSSIVNLINSFFSSDSREPMADSKAESASKLPFLHILTVQTNCKSVFHHFYQKSLDIFNTTEERKTVFRLHVIGDGLEWQGFQWLVVTVISSEARNNKLTLFCI
jgi:hypothetical protein